MNLEFIAEIREGTIEPDYVIRSFLRGNEGKKAKIILSWNLKKRSNKQNRFYFGPVIKSFREWFLEQGYNFNAKDVHEFIVSRIWKHTEVTFIDDLPFERRLSSTKLSTAEWERQIELTRQWAAEHGFMIGLPNDAEG